MHTANGPSCNDYRINPPRCLEVGFDLFLTRARPWSVVTLCYAYATVPEKYGHSVQRNASKEQFNGECVPEAVRMTADHVGEFKEPLQASLPLPLGAANRRLTGPEEKVLT